ncbi:hypothetical protein MAM1_0768d11218 [Mucor ambiguus]|uniref:C2H2-type domain-containing protein n=1 Tax=Mucor ambiguus TaxID=91626 RepID=A0A0C9LZ49_9FUNG|nr:hypothetical protein MAM1_0768d11218 [Mucor ambiguus]
MKLRRTPQRAKDMVKRSLVLTNTEQQPSRNRANSRQQTARSISPFNMKNEEDNQKDILSISISDSQEKDTTEVNAIRVKTETEQEDTAKVALHSNSVHNIKRFKKIKDINVEPDINDPNNYCKSCESQYKSRIMYRTHLKRIHHMMLQSLLKLKHKFEKTGIAPDPEDQNAYCCSCDRFYQNMVCYRRHLKAVHKMTPMQLKHKRRTRRANSIKNPNIVPDYYDPNLHCSSCNQTYGSKKQYRTHCAGVHGLRARSKPQKGCLPDANDLNNYCKACDYTYANKRGYRYHCYRVHGLKPPKFVNPDAIPDINNPYNYCKTCDKRYVARRHFKLHLRVVHKIQEDALVVPTSSCNKQPNIDDQDNYCCCCEKKFATKHSYGRHLFRKHEITRQTPRKDELLPDVDDPNNYCRVCQKNYRSKGDYRIHIQNTHQVKPAPLKHPRDSSTLLPDPNDPNYYCNVCNITEETRSMYRWHCKYAHFMELDHFSIKNRNAVIDINGPDFYCAQCERKYGKKRSFGIHLMHVHDINIGP